MRRARPSLLSLIGVVVIIASTAAVLALTWPRVTVSGCGTSTETARGTDEKRDAEPKVEEILPTIYVVTPTYYRLSQKADLTRLANTLKLVRNIVWVVVEDSDKRTARVSKILARFGPNHAHLHKPSADGVREALNSGPRYKTPRGIEQRNEGIRWILEETKAKSGVVYFADDDNTYDVRVFDVMRHTKRASAWLVALSGDMHYEGPVVESENNGAPVAAGQTIGRVVAWRTGWKPERKFPIDMAGFAVSVAALIENPKARFSRATPRGFLETEMLAAALGDAEIEIYGGVDEILVWHTRTEVPNVTREQKPGLLPLDPNIEV